MIENEGGGPCLWLHEEHAYAVVTADGAIQRLERGGLSHAEAMKFADKLRREGHLVIVMHVVGDKSYEVDRYPAR